jgi:hypothetical protein
LKTKIKPYSFAVETELFHNLKTITHINCGSTRKLDKVIEKIINRREIY